MVLLMKTNAGRRSLDMHFELSSPKPTYQTHSRRQNTRLLGIHRVKIVVGIKLATGIWENPAYGRKYTDA